MERRFEVRRREMLEECHVPPEVFEAMKERLEEFAQPFVNCLWRSEQKQHAQTYLSGLLSDLKRKNGESIAYRHDQDRRGLERFIGWSPWDHRPLVRELVQQVGREIGRPEGVIVFDPSGVQKKGDKSVAVGKQYLGRLGKIENCQVGIYMGYVSAEEHALVDMRLYLPKEWAKDKARRKAAGVPKEIRFQTRQELALEMLRDRGVVLPHAWVAGDDEMGRCTRFRRELRALGESYLLAVPSNTNVRDLEGQPPPYRGRGPRPKVPFRRADQWCASLGDDAWTRVDVRDGEKGPLVVEIAKTPVVARTQRSRTNAAAELLVVIRSAERDGKVKHDYYLSNADPQTSVVEFARVAKAEHRIEECLERAKSEAGLADYETRTWAGWHHHQTLSLIATWFLTQEARLGKKMGAGDHGAAGCRRAGDAAARSLLLREPGSHRARSDPPFGAKRASAVLPLEEAQSLASTAS
jgi:SRSO17 transposase